jgi:hypothetical protein
MSSARIAVNATAIATSGAQRGGPSAWDTSALLLDQLHNRGVNTGTTHQDPHFGRLCDARCPSICECMDQGSERGGGVGASRRPRRRDQGVTLRPRTVILVSSRF